MGFLVVGQGSYTEDRLIEKLEQLGIANPVAVIKEAAEKRIAICGRIKIMAIMG